MRIALLGLGLIGGSIVKALRAAGPAAGDFRAPTLAAWTPTGGGPRAAVASAEIDAVATSAGAALDGADLVILAAPPLAVLDLLDQLGGPLRSALATGAVVTDVASTKGAIVNRARSLDLPFVGGHPMAGREASGYGAASADLFRDRPWIVVTDGATAHGVATVEALAAACLARPKRMAAAAHDDAVAAISHLPLVLAAALVEAVVGSGDAEAAPDWPDLAELAASGWRDMTRLARGDVAMGAGIVATNAPPIAARLRAVRNAIDGWLAELERDGGPDSDRVADRLRTARARLAHTP